MMIIRNRHTIKSFRLCWRIMHIALRVKTLAMMVDVQVGIMDGETTNATSAMMAMTTEMMHTVTGMTTMVIRNDQSDSITGS